MRPIVRRRYQSVASSHELAVEGPAVAASPVFAQTTSPSLVKELVATWQRAATDIIYVAEAMPEEKYAYKPTPEISAFRDQLVHVAGIAQRFIDSAKGTKSESGQSHKAMTKAEVIGLLKQTFQTGQEMLGSLTDAQLLEQVKFSFRRPHGDPLHVLAGAALPGSQSPRTARRLSPPEWYCPPLPAARRPA